MTELVHYEISANVARVKLTRPEKLNALTLETLSQLIDTAAEIRKDRAVRAVVLSGEGDSFCAGLDFAAVLKKPASVAAALIPRPWRGTNTFQEACWAWRRLPVPVIAAVHGHCFGGGLQIALAADFRISHPDAEWSVLEGRWGLIPDMTGVQTLSELVGIETAKRLTMTADIVTGTQAHELGLVGTLAEKPEFAAEEFALKLAQRSPDALAAAKELFNRTWTVGPRRTFGMELGKQLGLLGAANTRAARTAAFQKSQPEYQPRAKR